MVAVDFLGSCVEALEVKAAGHRGDVQKAVEPFQLGLFQCLGCYRAPKPDFWHPLPWGLATRM